MAAMAVEISLLIESGEENFKIVFKKLFKNMTLTINLILLAGRDRVFDTSDSHSDLRGGQRLLRQHQRHIRLWLARSEALAGKLGHRAAIHSVVKSISSLTNFAITISTATSAPAVAEAASIPMSINKKSQHSFLETVIFISNHRVYVGNNKNSVVEDTGNTCVNILVRVYVLL